MDVLEAIYARRSVRKFTEESVSHEDLMELCRLGAAAPSAVNKCPWEFIISDEPTLMEQIRETMPYGKYNAPVALTVCGNRKHFLPNKMEDYWIEDTSAAMENILLGCTAMGYGSVWLGIYPNMKLAEEVSRLLRLSDLLIPMGMVYIGRPAEFPAPRTQLKANQIHWQYGSSKEPLE